MHLNRLLSVASALIVGAGTVQAQVDSALIAGLRWRNVGPANMAGRIADVEGIPSPSRTFFVAAAAGGVWKTTDNGTTFRPVFDNYGVASLGDLAIAPSDTNTLYLGTGEPNSRNSISPGGGVFKSTDGGLTWKFMGLKETQHIGRIVVHPTDPKTAYVAALGAAWTTNKERGLYKTTDGGENWTLIKFISDKAGFIDVELDPKDPNIVWAASYERLRGPYFLQSGGPGSALWKSTDAGATWTEVKGGGFPETMKGRIEIAISPSNPMVMYTMVEADTAPNTKKDPKAKPQTKPSGLYRSADGGKTWTKTNGENVRPFYYSQVRVHPTNPDRVWWSSTPVKVSNDGGVTAGNATVGLHVDHHAMWIDPKDPQRHIVGNDGGIGVSNNDGGSYIFPNAFAIGQFYNVSFDNAVPYNVCGGLQDNGSWCGPSRRKQGPITNAMWFTFNGGDGFVTAQDPTDPNVIYGESQGGNIGRYLVSTGERTALRKPDWRATWTAWEDSLIALRGDTTKPETPAMKKQLAAVRAQQKKDSIDLSIRWNWNTPFFISKHNNTTLYIGANRVFKSVKRGDDMFPISGDLSYADTMKIRISTETTGGITVDATGAETFGTIVSLNESGVRPGLLYAGTDDGRVWITRNDGGSWEELTSRIAGVPAGTYVSRIEPSSHDSATVYLTFDNHRRGDFTPYVFVSTDFGKSFRSIAASLPKGGPDFVHVIREDVKNPNLLFVGTDVGAYVSNDKGATWQKFMTGLPNVPVHDLQIHPRESELIAGTHGRAIWIVDIAPLQQSDAQVAAKPAHLYKPRVAQQYGQAPVGGESTGNMLFQAPSPQYGADIWYHLKSSTGPVRVVIQDATGDTIRTLNGSGASGLQRVTWDFRGRPAPARPLSPAGIRDSIKNVTRMKTALDSVEAAGEVPKAMVDMLRNSLIGTGGMAQLMAQMGGGGGGGGGFGGAPGRWVERPGEQLSPPAGGRRAGAAAAPAAGAAPDQNQMFTVIRAVMGRQGFGGLNRIGGGGAFVEPGDYLVSIKVGDAVLKQTLRVERASGGGGSGLPFEMEELEKAYNRWLRRQ